MQKLKYTLFVLLIIFQSPSGAVGKRIALVIGNSAYTHLNPLSNPDNDANAIALKLKALGFELMAANGRLTGRAVLDLNENNFLKAIKNFSRHAQGAEMAMIYYAGHGMQFGTGSYLLPVDVPKDDIDLLQRHAISLDNILNKLDGKAQLTIAVFDACREIPELDALMSESTRGTGLSRSSYRGLGRVKSQGRSRVIAFSGAAGQLVKDGAGQHSPYTEHLLQQLDTPNQEVGDIFRNVAYRFGQEHTGQQPVIEIQGVPPKHFYFIQQGGSNKPLEKKYKYPLYIKTTPADAKVRILNIGPAYQAGMLLNPGSYKIEISKPGYQRQLSNFDLTAETSNYYVELQAVSTVPVKPTQTRGFTDPITGMKFVSIKSGCFQMGSPASEAGRKSDERQHRVCISQDYYLGQYEVTQAQWRQVMGNNPSKHQGANYPVENVSWNDAQDFIAKLNQQSGLQYRLPTESEWEYAARAGTTTPFYTGQCISTDQANYEGNFHDYNGCGAKTGLHRGKTTKVGSFAANSWGLYDMSGNVWEWTCSKYDEGYSGSEKQCASKNDTNKGDVFAFRGSSFEDYPQRLRVAFRYRYDPWIRYRDGGFRLARTY